MRKALLYSACILSFTSAALPNIVHAEQTADHKEGPLLSLDDAIQKALEASPRLHSANAELNGAKAIAIQAAALPNPKLDIEAENIAGSGSFSGTDNAEITYAISQTIELGGERKYRRETARQGIIQGQYDLSIAHLNLIRDVRTAYNDAVSAQEMLTLAKERKALAKQLLKTVKKRVTSASEPEIQLRKAEIGLSTASVMVGRLEREYEHAKHTLSSLWTGHETHIILQNKGFFSLTEPLKETDVEERLSKTADMQRWNAEKSRALASYNLEKAEAIPDPSITVGIRDIRESNDQAFIFGMSVPLPVFDSNRGNIEFARSMLSKAESNEKTTQITMQNEAYEWLERQINAYHHAKTLKSDIIPAAQEAFDLARKGYRAGRFAYLEVLDAQRTLFEVKEQYIEALTQYHTASAYVERMTTPAGE